MNKSFDVEGKKYCILDLLYYRFLSSLLGSSWGSAFLVFLPLVYRHGTFLGGFLFRDFDGPILQQ